MRGEERAGQGGGRVEGSTTEVSRFWASARVAHYRHRRAVDVALANKVVLVLGYVGVAVVACSSE